MKLRLTTSLAASRATTQSKSVYPHATSNQPRIRTMAAPTKTLCSMGSLSCQRSSMPSKTQTTKATPKRKRGKSASINFVQTFAKPNQRLKVPSKEKSVIQLAERRLRDHNGGERCSKAKGKSFLSLLNVLQIMSMNQMMLIQLEQNRMLQQQVD